MRTDDLFDTSGLCIRCRHESRNHARITGHDGAHRTICRCCPPSTIRVMGDEGTENPIPFFIEGPFGSPIPCRQEHQASTRRENALPHSPGPYGPHQITFRARGEESEHDVQFSGTAWSVDEVQRLKHGDEVRGNIVYKLQLYWNQEGMCPGCDGRIRLDNMEMDRLVPGAAGGKYTVGNVQLLCSSCNRIKGDRDMGYLRERRRSQGFPMGDPP